MMSGELKSQNAASDVQLLNVARIKVIGERNTGTNFVESLLEANIDCSLCPGNLPISRRLVYKVLDKALPYAISRKVVEADRDREYRRRFQNELGWKHAKILGQNDSRTGFPIGTGFVAVVKNPYSWLISLHRRPYQNESLKSLPFSDFIRQPWRTVERENSSQEYYDNPVLLWNDKVASYSNLENFGPLVLARYEDVLQSLESFLQRVADTFGLSVRRPVQIPASSTKSDGRSTESIAKYYLAEKWRDKIKPSDIEYINSHLDHDLMATFKYTVLQLQKNSSANREAINGEKVDQAGCHT
jgi:hypothetical protein